MSLNIDAIIRITDFLSKMFHTQDSGPENSVSRGQNKQNLSIKQKIFTKM